MSTLGSPIATGATGVTEIPSDVGATIHVALPRPLIQAVRLHGQATGIVTVIASGASGRLSTTALDVQFVKSTAAAGPHPAKKKKKRKHKHKHRKRRPGTGASGATGATP